MEIELPFHPMWDGLLQTFRKTCTSRNSQKGNPGDTFIAFGTKFVITKVQIVQLDYISKFYYYQEGCENPIHFTQVYFKIYKSYNPQKLVYLHFFDKVNNGSQKEIYKV